MGMVVMVVVVVMIVLIVVVSNVQGCDLVQTECSNYLYMQLLEINFEGGGQGVESVL